jgi:hypothetical protein
VSFNKSEFCVAWVGSAARSVKKKLIEKEIITGWIEAAQTLSFPSAFSFTPPDFTEENV